MKFSLTWLKDHLETAATVEQIAARLGFSDASTFRRAFRKWCGTAPTR